MKIWDAADGRLLARLRGPGDEVNDVAYSPNGKRLAFSSFDGAIRVWNLDPPDDLEAASRHKPLALATDPSTDGMLCFPVNWIPDDDSAQVLDYFQKYVTTEVEVEDGAKVSPSQQTVFNYVGTPAWHFDDNEVVKPANRTYGQFRGFGEVDVITGNPTNSYQQVPDQQTETKTTYFRGMDGDTLPGGKTRSVTVTDSLGETLPDNNLFADTAYESQVVNGISGPEVSATITNPQVLATTATRARSGLAIASAVDARHWRSCTVPSCLATSVPATPDTQSRCKISLIF